MRTKAVCEGSPFRSNRQVREVGAQFQVMREMGLGQWDPTNAEATARLRELLDVQQPSVTVFNAEMQFAPKPARVGNVYGTEMSW